MQRGLKGPEERSGREVVLSKATNWNKKKKKNSEGKVKMTRLTELDRWCHWCVCRPSLSCEINTIKREAHWPTSPTLIFQFFFRPNVDKYIRADVFHQTEENKMTLLKTASQHRRHVHCWYDAALHAYAPARTREAALLQSAIELTLSRDTCLW